MVPGIRDSHTFATHIIRQLRVHTEGSRRVHVRCARGGHRARAGHCGRIHCCMTASRWSGSTGLVT
ncbi:hypothetical protein SAMN05428944_2351 [Streptomyces sp. 1222.5]|nr:hypothetical protein BX260_5743 [Streptomyces sp. 5112.2]SEC05584.1 hypothetical protein SAMN05428944_2351 [Streptomyces sp. 1222.5]SED86341.1 hypothetical protein SAMN05216532_6018 [Streptomyces sp. 2231.1]